MVWSAAAAFVYEFHSWKVKTSLHAFGLYLPYSKKMSFVFGLDVCMMREKLVTKMYKQCSCLVPNAALLYKQGSPLLLQESLYTDSSMHLFICSIGFVYATDGLNS